MSDHQTFRNSDLVLNVNENVNPSVFDIGKYEPFIEALCGSRDYQKDAIRVALAYILGENYSDMRDLAEQNYYRNLNLQERYGSLDNFARHLQLPSRLSFNQDLATATGKSYVMYGIARIMLAEGVIDRVLVLGPSLTIEEGLTKKFEHLSRDSRLTDVLPESAKHKNPAIINGSQTIVPGAICIENFHAVLGHVGSSIRDSLRGKGERTLVLNDEAHHVYNKPVTQDKASRELKEWKKFLVNPEFGFKYVGGFSGTCYVGNDYFADVIYRYSLRDAIEDGFVKTIDYVSEDASQTSDERFQKILANHKSNQNTYRNVKPITVLVTRNISTCKDLSQQLKTFLCEHEGISEKEAGRKVLPVTSAKEHQANINELKHVDSNDNPVEWLVSVSMLTEGWDVDNVFQIVPHEERAFNSKLLIAQVLGRGLRVPEEYKRAKVTVFNHDAWSTRIEGLVREVIEQEKRLTSQVIEKPEDYNFTLHQIDYGRVQQSEKIESEEESEIEKGYVNLISQAREVESQTTYASTQDNSTFSKSTTIRYRMYSVDQMVEKVHNKLQVIDLETDGETSYAEVYNEKRLRAIIEKSLHKVGVEDHTVSERNHQRILKAFGAVNTSKSRAARFKSKAKGIDKINTNKRPEDSVGFSALRRNVRIFLDDYSYSHSNAETKHHLDQIEDNMLLERALSKVANTYDFKTPQNLVIADSDPEFKFVKHLTSRANAKALNGWIKSTAKNFYSIEYAFEKGPSLKRGNFNPDFFIKKGDDILVIEIKDNSQIRDPSLENKAKFEFARRHFEKVNDRQEDCTYHFHFLTPSDFDLFFQKMRDGQHPRFQSQLNAALKESSSVESVSNVSRVVD